MNQDDYLDKLRDVYKESVYKCSCGARLIGGPASYHALILKHKYERELFPWEKKNDKTDL